MAELIFWPGQPDSPGGSRPGNAWAGSRFADEARRSQTPVGGEHDMRNIEAVLSDLEYRRLRRRFVMHPAEAMVLNCGTWAVIAVLRYVAR